MEPDAPTNKEDIVAPWDLVYKTWLGKNVYNLIPGLRKLAEATGLKLSRTPNANEIQQLFKIWGSEKAFIENAPAVAEALQLDGFTVPDRKILDLLWGTETLEEFPIRSVRGKLKGGLGKRTFIVVITAGTANWTKRRVQGLDLYYNGENFGIARVYALASERSCTLDTEVDNILVKRLGGVFGRPPTEAELLGTYLDAADLAHEMIVGGSLEEQVTKLVEAQPSITEMPLLVPTNANATYVPLAIRRFLKQADPRFDYGRDQFWFFQDEFPLAMTPEEAGDTDNYQRPLTVLSGLVRLVNELYQLKA